MLGKRIFKLFFVVVLFPMFINAQEKDSSGVLTKKQRRMLHPRFISLTIGYHSWNSANSAVEIGLGRSVIGRNYESAQTWARNFIFNQSISAEVYFANTTILAPKYNLSINSGKKGVRLFTIGLNILGYTDFNQNAWALRFEGGFYLPQGYSYLVGHRKLKFVYGYNYFLKGNNFSAVSPHVISIVFFTHGNTDLRRINK